MKTIAIIITALISISLFAQQQKLPMEISIKNISASVLGSSNKIKNVTIEEIEDGVAKGKLNAKIEFYGKMRASCTARYRKNGLLKGSIQDHVFVSAGLFHEIAKRFSMLSDLDDIQLITLIMIATNKHGGEGVVFKIKLLRATIESSDLPNISFKEFTRIVKESGHSVSGL